MNRARVEERKPAPADAADRRLNLAAHALQAAGRPDQARDLIVAEACMERPLLALYYLRLAFDIQDYPEFQSRVEAWIGADRETLAAAPAKLLELLIQHSEKIGLPAERTRTLIDVAGSRLQGEDSLAAAWRSFVERQRYRQGLRQAMAGRATIIPLGLSCLPNHLPAVWGLRTPDQFARTINPFSLAGHRIEGVISAIESDFQGYCDPDMVKVQETAGGYRFAVRKDETAFWNHNHGEYWLADDFARLRQDIALKSENFRRSCREPDAVFFMSRALVDDPEAVLEFLPRLNRALARHTGADRNRIVIGNETADRPASPLIRLDDYTRFLYRPYPREGYIWHLPATRDSPAGLAYEEAYTDRLVEALNEWGLLHPVRNASPASAAT